MYKAGTCLQQLQFDFLLSVFLSQIWIYLFIYVLIYLFIQVFTYLSLYRGKKNTKFEFCNF